MYQTASALKVRPSELLALQDDPYAAYCLDTSVVEFGQALEAAISGVEGKSAKERKGKMERLVRKWLDMPARYRSPSTVAGRKEG